MTANLKQQIKQEASSALSSVLLNVIDTYNTGDSTYADDLGLTSEDVETLESIQGPPLFNLSKEYFRSKNILSELNIENDRLIDLIRNTANNKLILMGSYPDSENNIGLSHLKIRCVAILSIALFAVLEGAKDGDLDLAINLGMNRSDVLALEMISAPKILHLCESYFADSKDVFNLLNINNSKVKALIKAEISHQEYREISDEFMRRGASRKLLQDFFAIYPKLAANRKSLLGVKTRRGRKNRLTKDQRLGIYNSWLENIHLDIFQRYLKVNDDTRVDLGQIHDVITEIEQTKNYPDYIELLAKTNSL